MKNSLSTNYGTYILIWLGLVMITLFDVAIAGLKQTNLTVVIIMIIAVIGSFMIANYFLSVKPNSKISKVFIYSCGVVLLILIVLIVL
jgi:caa(3)-type oxidase subunit IV